MKGAENLDGAWRSGGRLIEVFRGGQCIGCHRALQRGEPAWWLPNVGAMECRDCHERIEGASPDVAGEAGRSMHAEWERRHGKDRGAEGPAVSNDPRIDLDRPTTAAWALGARGERITGEALAQVDDTVKLLHDRAIPGERGNIDHITVGPAGVFVINTKYEIGAVSIRQMGKTPEGHLFVGGWNRSRYVAAARRHARRVREVLGQRDVFEVPVMPVLCFVDNVFDLQGHERQIGGVRLAHPAELVRLVSRGGPLSPETVEVVHRTIGGALPRKLTA